MPRRRGATLIELIALMAVLAILAGAAIPALGQINRTRSASAARQLAGDLADARRLAVAEGRTIWITIEQAPVSWWFGTVLPDTPEPAIMLHPDTGLPMSFTLAESPWHGAGIIGITIPSSPGPPFRIGFDHLGRPRTAGGQLLDSDATILFTHQCEVRITSLTGLIDVQTP